jgi:hypothetical protein
VNVLISLFQFLESRLKRWQILCAHLNVHISRVQSNKSKAMTFFKISHPLARYLKFVVTEQILYKHFCLYQRIQACNEIDLCVYILQFWGIIKVYQHYVTILYFMNLEEIKCYQILSVMFRLTLSDFYNGLLASWWNSCGCGKWKKPVPVLWYCSGLY